MFRGMDMNGKSTTYKKKFPMGWLFLVATVSLFLGVIWNYMPAARGIVSLFVFSKFLAGLCGTHLLL